MKNSRLIITTIITLLITYSAKSQPVIADFQVNENLTNRWVQDAPIVLVHSNSNYMVVWKDDRELVGVFAQVFSSDGTPLSDDFQLVGAQSSSAYNETFAAAVNENGTFVIVWKGGGNFPRVFAQLFDSSGAAIGENFPVTEYVGNTTESFPSVVFGKDDTFIICIDARNPHSLYGDIFARRFAPDGTPLGSEFKVNDDGGTLTRQERADISSNSNGEFVITWEDFRVDFNGGDIYAQRYDSDGNHLGPNLFVDLESPVDRIRQTDPVCSLDDSGKFMIVWNTRAWDHSNPDIFAQFYDGDGNRIDSNFVVTDPTYSISDLQPEEPAVAVNENGKFLVSWTDFRNNNDDIFTQLYESNGTAIGSNFKINDDGGESAQSSPDVATNNNGEFIFTWWDYRNDGFGSQIYLQRCTENGSPIGGNFHTTNEGTVMVPTIEGDPNIVVDSQGAFMVVWIDLREIPGPGIDAQRYESKGTPID